MATVDKSIADRIIAGEFAEDQPRRIIKYINHWGGESYGVEFATDRPGRYEESDFVQSPTVYWEAP